MKKCIICLLFFLLVSTLLQALDFVPRDIYKKASPAVVFISSFNEGKAIGTAGSGSIISYEGLVLTNNHVIADSSNNKPYDNIVVCLKPLQLTGDETKDLSDSYHAEVVARNSNLDLAVLRIKGVKKELSVISIGDASKVVTGDQVAAIGHPEGGGLWVLTTGTISGTKKIGDKDTFQTEASTNRGNSGGPLLNAADALIGINTCMVRKADDGLAIVGVNFAIKSTQVKKWLNENGVKVVTVSTLGASEPPKVQPAQPQPPNSQPVQANPPRGPEAIPPADKKPKSPQAKPVPSTDSKQGEEDLDNEFKEFNGANGEVMYGLQDSKFNLDRATTILFEKTKKNAENSFKELDNLEKEIEK